MKIMLVMAAAILLGACDSISQIVEDEVKEQVSSVADQKLEGMAVGNAELEKMLNEAKKDGNVTNEERAAFMTAYTAGLAT